MFVRVKKIGAFNEPESVSVPRSMSNFRLRELAFLARHSVSSLSLSEKRQRPAAHSRERLGINPVTILGLRPGSGRTLDDGAFGLLVASYRHRASRELSRVRCDHRRNNSIPMMQSVAKKSRPIGALRDAREYLSSHCFEHRARGFSLLRATARHSSALYC